VLGLERVAGEHLAVAAHAGAQRRVDLVLLEYRPVLDGAAGDRVDGEFGRRDDAVGDLVRAV
jgi:hypothetical protein